MIEPTPTIAIVCGETSGDYLGAQLITAIKQQIPNAKFIGIAGAKMQAAGCETLYDMHQLNVMGFTEILSRIFKIIDIRRNVIKKLLALQPACFIGIDASAFNIEVEYQLKKHGILTIHYNSPKVWAWRESRIHRIKKAVDLMLCLLPFECDIYHKYHIPVAFVGHPMADDIPLKCPAKSSTSTTVALLPGSRGFEIKRLAPIFFQTAAILQQQLPTIKFMVPVAHASQLAVINRYQQQYAKHCDITIAVGRMREFVAASDVVLVASGTATLETMLLKKPMVVAYRLSTLSYLIIRWLARVNYIALPNLIANKMLVPEYIQQAATPQNLSCAVMDWLNDKERYQQTVIAFEHMHRTLQQNAAKMAADQIIHGIVKDADSQTR